MKICNIDYSQFSKIYTAPEFWRALHFNSEQIPKAFTQQHSNSAYFLHIKSGMHIFYGSVSLPYCTPNYSAQITAYHNQTERPSWQQRWACRPYSKTTIRAINVFQML